MSEDFTLDDLFDLVDELSGARKPPDNSMSAREYADGKGLRIEAARKRLDTLVVKGKMIKLEGKYTRSGMKPCVYYQFIDSTT
jgi:hypothetical protein